MKNKKQAISLQNNIQMTTFQVPRHATHDIGWNLLKDIEKQSGVKF